MTYNNLNVQYHVITTDMTDTDSSLQDLMWPL